MTPAAANEAVTRALTLSQRMLDASDEADWERVRDLHEALEQALREAGAPGPEQREAFATLLTRQQQVSARAQAAQRELEQDMSRSRYNQRALHAYLSPRR